MKSLRFIISIISVCVLTLTNLHGQSFMRYKMKDGSYNGFYTSAVDSICHLTENGAIVQKVYVGESVRTIPIDDIIEISFEAATLDSEQDAGEYKIVELDGTEGFKKAYVDNRATLIASKTGDFLNDTLLVSSAYNNIKFLLFTDEVGRITRYFDGETQLIFDTDDDAFVVNDAFPDTRTFNTKVSAKPIWNALVKLFEKHGGIKEDILLWGYSQTYEYLAKNLDIIANDPELHSQRCIVAGLSFAGAVIDPMAYVLSALRYLNPDNDFIGLVDDFYGGIIGSYNDLLKEMKPDSETMERYKDFYARKYNLELSTLPATYIFSTSAILNGIVYTEDELRGHVSFRLVDNDNNETIFRLSPTEDKINQWPLFFDATSLTPDTQYKYCIQYICTVDKLKLVFNSDFVEFRTRCPWAYTGDVHDITSTSAVVECNYTNIDECWCGVYYYECTSDGESIKREVAANPTSGTQSITLSGLTPNTKYKYQAVARFKDYEDRGDTYEFTTKPNPLPDLTGTWVFEQKYFGDSSLTVTLMLESCTETSASYVNFGNYYGTWDISVNVNTNGVGSIQVYTANPAYGGARFNGEWDKDFSKLSGDHFYRHTEFNTYLKEEAWSFYR